MTLFNKANSYWVVVLLLFFLVDEIAFILYNISFFQFMCANTISLFFTDEIPTYASAYNYDVSSLVYTEYVHTIKFCTYYSMDNSINISDVFYVIADTPKDLNAFTYNDTTSISTLDELQTTYYKIKLEATNVKKNTSSFYPLQQYIYTIPGESSLIFYRLENRLDIPVHTLSVYVTTPAEAVAYIKKLQCFCYEELMIAPNSIIDLPILFSIDEEILNEEFKEITINYILLLK